MPLTFARLTLRHLAIPLGLGLLLSAQASGAYAAEHMDHEMGGHEHHHVDTGPAGVARSEANYSLPALELIRQDGKKVNLPKEIDDGRPVILNFIYTSCTAICPTTSQVFSQVQAKLDKEHKDFRLVSISIDPEYDTPARLAAYGKKFGAGNQWQFYSGTSAASIAVQKSLDAYHGDKMNHLPITFLRAAPGKPWVRLEGFASPETVLQEFARLGSKS
jgi:protein SCO1/2